MDRRERRERAKADTHGLKDWRRGVATAVTAGGCSVVALVLFGPEDASVSEAIVIVASIGGAYVLRPAAEFGWNYLWTPWRVLSEQVTGFVNRPAPAATSSPTPEDRVAKAKVENDQFQAISARLGVLRRLQNELRKMNRGAAKVLQTGAVFGSGWKWENSNWRTLGDGLGGIKDMQAIYEMLRDCYDELDDLKLGYISSISGQLEDDGKAKLVAAQPIFDRALDALDTEIERLTKL